MSFDFKKINILIGDQGTGKSTVAKLVSAINSMVAGETLTPGASGLMRIEEYGKIEHFKRHIEKYEIGSYLNEQTNIRYQHTLFEFDYSNSNCGVTKTKTTSGNEVSLNYLNTTFIPADRAAVNLLSNELLYSLNEINQDLPGYFVRFGQLFNRLKKNQNKYDFSDTLGVVYKFENGQDKIEIKDSKQIRMSDASSAFQTNIPLLVVLQYQSIEDLHAEYYSSDLNVTVIEEPELNCFPLLQNAILKYIIKCVRSEKGEYGRRVIITTHSPYILTSLNNLIYAFEVGINMPDRVSKIIDKKYWINPEDVSSYRLMPDGSCKNILSKSEDGTLIAAEEIDEVSSGLNKEFNELIDLEIKNEEMK